MLRYKEVKQMLAELIADKRNGDRLPSRISLNRQLDSMGDYMDVAYVRGSYTLFRKGMFFFAARRPWNAPQQEHALYLRNNLAAF